MVDDSVLPPVELVVVEEVAAEEEVDALVLGSRYCTGTGRSRSSLFLCCNQNHNFVQANRKLQMPRIL